MRNINIDRDPISSEEISTFKDFKSILRKHAQTTEDLAKIKPGSNNSMIFWAVGIVAAVATTTLLLLNNSVTPSVEELALNQEIINKPTEFAVAVNKDSVESKPVLVQKSVEWKTIIRTPKKSVEQVIAVNEISADRVDYFTFENQDEIELLLKGIKKSDADFVKNSLVFKTSGEESLKLLSSQELYRLNDDGKWKKVNSNPVSMPYIEKPLLYKSSNPSYEFTFTNFNGPASKYTDVRWTPVDNKDAKRINDFLDNNTQLTDATITSANIEGVYNITLVAHENEFRFNAYPTLTQPIYEDAMKAYNLKLQKAQEILRVTPKTYEISQGVYTTK